jgi:hypothetical protein
LLIKPVCFCTHGFSPASNPPFDSRSTVTVKLHVAALVDASVAVQVTVVTPTGKVVPEAGVHETVVEEQVSEAEGAV